MSNFKGQIIHSIRWNTFSISITTLLQIILMVWLARLLAPSDFGAMAIIWVFLRLANPITQGGLSQSIIRHISMSRIQYSSILWLNIFIGLLVYSILFIISFPISSFFQIPQLSEYLKIASLSLLLLSFGNTFQGLFTRDLKFKKLAVIQIGGQVVEFISALTLAYMGKGVWALVWGSVVRAAVTSGLAIYWGFREYPVSLVFRWRAIRGPLTFGAFETGSLLINNLNTQIDKVLIGKMLGPHSLGLYTIAWELIIIPSSRINPILLRVAYPVFSRIHQDINQLNIYFQKTLQGLMMVNMPALAGLAMLAHPFLLVVYGEPWAKADQALSILILTGISRALANPGASILLAKGRSDIHFLWNVGWIVAIASILWFMLGHFPTLEGAAWSQALAAVGLSWIWYYLLHRYGGIRLYPLLKMLTRQLGLLLPMVGGILIVLMFIEQEKWELMVATPAGVLIYGATLWGFSGSGVRGIINWLRTS